MVSYYLNNSSMLKYSTQEIIEKFKKIHGDKYDYSKFEYFGINEKSIIICPIHGNFIQSAKLHLSKRGCTKCGHSKAGKSGKRSIAYYINLAKEVHGEKYIYDLVINNYTSCHKKHSIICPKHGIFNQTLYAHIHKKCGCPTCYREKKHGFNLCKWASNSSQYIVTLYIINIFNQTESFIKIGITYQGVVKRFYNLKQSNYNYNVLATVSIPEKGGRAIALIEMELHNSLQEYKYKPKNSFKGQGECYSMEKITEILQKIQYEIDIMRYNLMAFENLKDDCCNIEGPYSKYINTRSEDYIKTSNGMDQ